MELKNMFVTKRITFGEDFMGNVRLEIQNFYEANGYPPNAVFIHPHTDSGTQSHIIINLGGLVYQIPLKVRKDLTLGYGLADDQALFDANSPKKPF